MEAVRLYAAGDLRHELIDAAPAPKADEVRVRVAYGGLCGSDVHNYKTGQWISRAPSVAGHEFSGLIDAVGADVEGFDVGDHVVADSRYFCGACANCLDGKAQLCERLGFVGEAIDGGFAQYTVLPARLVLKMSPHTPLGVAALAEPLAVALHAINRLSLEPGATLLIVGCGPIGALCALVAARDGAATILVSDRNQARLDAVCAMSGAQAFTMDDTIPTHTMPTHTMPTHTMPTTDRTGTPIRFALDTTGSVAVIEMLVAKLNGATIGLVGIGSGKLALDPVDLVERELSLVGCHAFQYELHHAVQLLDKDPERFAPVIGEILPLCGAEQAYKNAMAGANSGIKTLFSIGDMQP